MFTSGEAYIIQADVPGIKKDNIFMHVNPNNVRIVSVHASKTLSSGLF